MNVGASVATKTGKAGTVTKLYRHPNHGHMVAVVQFSGDWRDSGQYAVSELRQTGEVKPVARLTLATVRAQALPGIEVEKYPTAYAAYRNGRAQVAFANNLSVLLELVTGSSRVENMWVNN
jgi:ABC-type amino acid transport substrate-binding protein